MSRERFFISLAGALGAGAVAVAAWMVLACLLTDRAVPAQLGLPGGMATSGEAAGHVPVPDQPAQ